MGNNEMLQKSLDYDNLFALWYDASNTYYNSDEPIMSDLEFDELTETLSQKYEDSKDDVENFIFNVVSKGIQISNGEFLIPEKSETIDTSQISLKKIKYNGSTTIAQIKKFLGEGTYNSRVQLYIAPKLDGISIKIKLEPQLLIQTRGGQDLTQELKTNPTISNVISQLADANIKTIHGELVIDKQVFNEKYSEEYENPRNCIIGVIKTNPNDLVFVPCTDGFQPINFEHNMKIYSMNIFWKLWEELIPGVDLEHYFNKKYKNDKYSYQVDGIVIGHKLEDVSRDFQIKNNYPLNMVAIKFKAQSVETIVTDIEWSIKKSGKLTPILHVKPVVLDGSTVTKASGYSYHTLKSKRIGIGSLITIYKSGDIIPTVDRVLSRSTNWNLPQDIAYVEDGKHIKTLLKTDEQKLQKFILGIKLLQLDGIGPVISNKIGKLVDFNIIKLFDTTLRPDIKIMLGSDSANWYRFEQFYNIKTLPLDQLIEMLQIDNCGKTLSKKFADIMVGKKIDTKGINKQLLQDVCTNTGKYNSFIKESMNLLKNYGVKVIKPIEVSENSFSFEMTGDPPGMTKKQFIEKFKEKNPNAIHSSLTKDSQYLFVDSLSTNTSKANKARKYNVKIMTYDDALKLDL